MRLFALITLLLAVGCAHTQPTVHGIPNFGVVVPPSHGYPGIYRGGEPTPEGNAYLKSLGVTRQVKLDISPQLKVQSPKFQIVYIPISTGEQIFGFGLDRDIPKAAAAIVPGTFVHCTYGKNRTGTVIGYYLVMHGATKAQATHEMLHYGWGDSLPGLKWFWSQVQSPGGGR